MGQVEVPHSKVVGVILVYYTKVYPAQDQLWNEAGRARQKTNRCAEKEQILGQEPDTDVLVA